MTEGWAVAVLIGVDLALGALVLWWFPRCEHPTRRQIIVFTTGLAVLLPGLTAAVLLFLTAG